MNPCEVCWNWKRCH